MAVCGDLWAETKDPRLCSLPEGMPRQLEQDYQRHAQIIVDDMKKNYIRIVGRLDEVCLPMDSGDLSDRTDRLSDAIQFASQSRFTKAR